MPNKNKLILPLGLHHQEALVGALSPQQKAELITDPDSGALQNVTFIRAVLTSLTLSGNFEQLTEFFQSFAELSKQVGAEHLANVANNTLLLMNLY